MENTYLEVEYLEKEYTKLGIQKTNSSFDFNIYPGERYIPQCSVCKLVYDTHKNDKDVMKSGYTIESPHVRCGCLWWSWFREKFLQLNNTINFCMKK